MRSVSLRWLCGVGVLCGTIAFGQSISSNVSAAEGEPVSATAVSNVSESVGLPSNAAPGASSVTAFSEAPSQSIEESGREAGYARSSARMPAPRIGALSTQGRLSFRLASQRDVSSQPLARFRAGYPGRSGPEYPSPAHVESLGVAAHDFGPPRKNVAIGEAAAPPLSGVIPDSTRGSGFPSPADTGTVSPLDWRPGLDFGFTDFSQRQFLNPTLNVGSRATGRGPNDRRLRARRNGLVRPPSSLPGQHLNTGLDNGSQLRTSMQNSLSTSIDQQVGLAPAGQP